MHCRCVFFSTMRPHCFNNVRIFDDSAIRLVRSGRRSRARNDTSLAIVGSSCCSSLICDGGMLGSVPVTFSCATIGCCMHCTADSTKFICSVAGSAVDRANASKQLLTSSSSIGTVWRCIRHRASALAS